MCPLCGEIDSTKHAYETCCKLPFHEELLGKSTNTKIKPFIRKTTIIKLQAIRIIRGEAIKKHNNLLWSDRNSLSSVSHKCVHIMDKQTYKNKIMELSDDKCIIITNEKQQIIYDKKKVNKHLHSIKVALSDSEIWDNNFEEQINEKLQTLLKYSGILTSVDGKYIKPSPHLTLAEAPTQNNTTVTALRERGSLEGLANGPSG